MKKRLGLILMLAMVFTGCNEAKESMNNENINSNQVVEEKDDTATDEVISDDGVTKDEETSSNQVAENEDITSAQATDDEEVGNDEVATKEDTSNDVVTEDENTSNGEVVTGKDVIIDEVATEDDEIRNYSNYKYIEDIGELIWKSDGNRNNVDEVLEGVFEKSKPSEQIKLSITYFLDEFNNQESIVELMYGSKIHQVDSFTQIKSIYMVDIDIDDDYKELYVHSRGGSGDIEAEIFRIIDGEFIYLGSVAGTIKCDQRGHFISRESVIRFADEPLIGTVVYVEDNTIKVKSVINEEIDLVVNQDGTWIVFYPESGYEEVILKKGDIFKIYSIDDEMLWWNVEFNGVKGRMSLYVAG